MAFELEFCVLFKEHAVSAFNFLVSENRFVGAALLPSRVYQKMDNEATLVFERAELYKELSSSSGSESKSNEDVKKIDGKKP